MKNDEIFTLPLSFEVETKIVLKKATEAHSALAELKGVCRTIPNEAILLNTLILQEAKESSEIENIITTHDELFRGSLLDNFISNATKEVLNYAEAMRLGFDLIKKNGFLSNNFILKIQEKLEKNKAGFRKLTGTALKNDKTGEVIYTPPQQYDEIIRLMNNLEFFINDDENEIDNLVKMAIIHFQFETIHPFYDGNGRTGRIINVLYLVLKGLLDFPILYLSRYITENKQVYYQLLQTTRTNNTWEEWILFMLEGIKQTSKKAIVLISEIRLLMDKYKAEIREKLPKIYSKDLLENLFKHPYTKVDYLKQDLMCSDRTTLKYLKELVEAGFLEKYKVGRSVFYLNKPLFDLFLKK
ncbi:MAG: Fic family protein [Cytophagales bacterium]|nr:MAG: Fic family protein [Cytophagales bacterium]